jgi:hypothetical protein
VEGENCKASRESLLRACQWTGTAPEPPATVMREIVAGAVGNAGTMQRGARAIRLVCRRKTTKLVLPRISMLTEPITCSGTAANLGRQSASAFATQRALFDRLSFLLA